jgi:hypothetical protein
MLAAEIEPAFAAARGRGAVLDIDSDRDGLERALCRLLKLSRHGAHVQTYSPLTRGATMWLTLPRLDVRAVTVVWVNDFVAGCQFFEPLDPEDLDLLLEVDPTLRHDG